MANLPAELEPGGRKPMSIVSVEAFGSISRRLQAAIPAVRGHVTPGLALGLAHEIWRTGVPRALKPVQFVGVFGGVLLAASARDAVLRSRLVDSTDLLPAFLRSDRGADEQRTELVFPFAGRSPSWLWADDEHPCVECGRKRHTWRGVVASSIPDHLTHFNVADFTTKFVVREDLAAVLGEVAGPTLSFVPVELHRE